MATTNKTSSRLKRAILFVLPALASIFFLYDPEPPFTVTEPLLEVSARAKRLHREAIVVDLHVDSLIWPRELTIDSGRGHLDFERASRGGLDVVSMTNPTQYFGAAGLKAFHDLWPPRSWFSAWHRLRYQTERMRRYAMAEDGIRLTSDPVEIRRNHDQDRLSVFHGIEGAHALGRETERVRLLSEMEVVFVAPVHLADNAYGGSSSSMGGLGGRGGRGLTPLGETLVQVMNEERILLDLSHASPNTFSDAIERTSLPPIVSHAGVRGVYDSWRNLSDDQIRAVASRGGVIGVMIAPPALARPSLKEFISHIEHVVEIGGMSSIAIGTDFDGYVNPSIDVSLLPQITERLVRRGWSDEEIKLALGENVLRVLGTRASQEPI